MSTLRPGNGLFDAEIPSRRVMAVTSIPISIHRPVQTTFEIEFVEKLGVAVPSVAHTQMALESPIKITRLCM